MSDLKASQARINRSKLESLRVTGEVPQCNETKITSQDGVSLTFTKEGEVYFNGNKLSQLHDVALDELKGLDLTGMSKQHHELLQKAIQIEQNARSLDPVMHKLHLVAMLDAALRQGGQSDITIEQRIDFVYGLIRTEIGYTFRRPGSDNGYRLQIDFTTPDLLTNVYADGELWYGCPMKFRSVMDGIITTTSTKPEVSPRPSIQRVDNLRAKSTRSKFITGLTRDPNRAHTNQALFESTLTRIMDSISGSEVRQGYEVGLIDRYEFKAEICLDQFRYPVKILESRLSGIQAGQTVTLSAFIDLLISVPRETTHAY